MLRVCDRESPRLYAPLDPVPPPVLYPLDCPPLVPMFIAVFMTDSFFDWPQQVLPNIAVSS
jgi:hypothetical protein